jgi:hypothetical protein
MIVSAVIDPPLFASTEAHDETQLIHLLRGLVLNGLLLTDNNSILSGSIRESRLAAQSPRIRELVIKVFQDFSFQSNVPPSTAVERAVASICDKHGPDLVVSDRIPYPEDLGSAAQRMSRLREYHLSPCETQRLEFASGEKPMDQLGVGGFGDLLRRTFRFSRWLRLYDQYLANGEGESRFRKGLAFILAQWRQCCCHPVGECSVELVSVDRNSANGVSRLEGMIRTLQQEFPVKFDLTVVRDPDHKFHARHIETREFVVQADPGLDFFTSSGELRRVLLKPARNDRGHLSELRRLPLAMPRRSFPVPR